MEPPALPASVALQVAMPILDSDQPRQRLVEDALAHLSAVTARSGLRLAGLPNVDTTGRASDLPGEAAWDGDYVVAVAPVAPPPRPRRPGMSGPLPHPERLDADMIEARWRGERVRLSPREKHAAVQIGLYQQMPPTTVRMRLRLSGAELKRFSRDDWREDPTDPSRTEPAPARR